MEAVVLILFVVLGLPFILSIVALVQASGAKREARELRAELRAHAMSAPSTAHAREAAPSGPAATTPQAPALPAPTLAPAAAPEVRPAPEPAPRAAPLGTEPPVISPPAPPPPPPRAPQASLEVALGGRIASFAGIAMLLIGLVFLMAYAMKNAWLGPGARVVLGLLSGGALVGLGQLAERRGAGKLGVLARVLTGGGAALFYFCVYAAFGIYKLVGAPIAAAGLLASAAATLGLAIAYRSQAVALIGVLGAFIMPVLVSEDSGSRTFLMSYIALINLPVIALGLQRNWQGLYNTAFGLTALYGLVLLADGLTPANAGPTLAFFTLFSAEFCALSLLKLRQERQVAGRTVDLIRIVLNAAAYLGALYVLLDRAGWDDWTGAAFIAVAAAYVLLVRASRHWIAEFREDTLAFLIAALTFATLALPVQLDGAWVCLGWSIEGLILCWFALRARVAVLKVAGFGLGLVGLMKSLLFDHTFYDAAPTLFLNARFAVGMASALLLGAQAWLHGRSDDPDEGPTAPWSAGLLWATAFGLVVAFSADAFWTLGANASEAWLLSSLAMLAVGAGCAVLARSVRSASGVALLLLGLLPVKLIIDALVIMDLRPPGLPAFFHAVFAGQLLLAALALWAGDRGLRPAAAEPRDAWEGVRVGINLVALAALVLVVSTELFRMPAAWGRTLVTIWWAGSAMLLVAHGMFRRNASHRYMGLALFGLATLKAFFVDMADLRGLERIAAFIGLGLLLLALSFLYQKMSEKLVVRGGGEGDA